MKQNLQLTAGELIVFSSGDYSDYSYMGAFVILENVSTEQMLEEAAAVLAAQGKQYNWEYEPLEKFVASLIKRGWLATINLREIHSGSYNRLELGQ